jgi:hypothetical protein
MTQVIGLGNFISGKSFGNFKSGLISQIISNQRVLAALFQRAIYIRSKKVLPSPK